MTPKKEQNKTRKKTTTPRRMLYILLGLAVAIAAFLILIFPIVFIGTPETRTIKIPANATTQNLSDTLTKYYGGSFSSNVMRLVKIRKPDLAKRHGAYRIEKGTNALKVMRRLLCGAQTPVTITINGFRSLPELCNRISRRLDFTPDSMMNLLENRDTLSRYGLSPENAIALFINDSYEFYWSASPARVIDKIGKKYLDVWNASRSGKARNLGLTPAEVMTLCSIVDEETNASSEKGTVARLYLNRLTRGMKLQADPTVRYAVGDFSIRRVRGEHLNVESPYNTYRYSGLPPGPIRTVGVPTIDLVLDSKPNDYLYMCAKEDFSGTHNFAESFAQHSENAKKYRQALDKRGIH